MRDTNYFVYDYRLSTEKKYHDKHVYLINTLLNNLLENNKLVLLNTLLCLVHHRLLAPSVTNRQVA